MGYFRAIIAKGKKFAKAEMKATIEEYEEKLSAWHAEKREEEEAERNALEGKKAKEQPQQLEVTEKDEAGAQKSTTVGNGEADGEADGEANSEAVVAIVQGSGEENGEGSGKVKEVNGDAKGEKIGEVNEASGDSNDEAIGKKNVLENGEHGEEKAEENGEEISDANGGMDNKDDDEENAKASDEASDDENSNETYEEAHESDSAANNKAAQNGRSTQNNGLAVDDEAHSSLEDSPEGVESDEEDGSANGGSNRHSKRVGRGVARRIPSPDLVTENNGRGEGESAEALKPKRGIKARVKREIKVEHESNAASFHDGAPEDEDEEEFRDCTSEEPADVAEDPMSNASSEQSGEVWISETVPESADGSPQIQPTKRRLRRKGDLPVSVKKELTKQGGGPYRAR
eukprot:TRINITY_DN6860_c0_g1_i1.p1 TRINITY_DN6860_c0_g1~~TRINITY_DN6860_c0_g1_i1.p1  ORF type:complete len:456 (-),score=124.89 TRINITY_DN6860_c0_g1_i1:503-1705(-)